MSVYHKDGSMIREAHTQGINALPAITGATIYGITLNEMVAILTMAYILLQAAYLIWKWIKEARSHGK